MTASCSLAPGDASAKCGCPQPQITYEDCLMYDVYCPPSAFQPIGYTLVSTPFICLGKLKLLYIAIKYHI